eukprot:RCo030154
MALCDAGPWSRLSPPLSEASLRYVEQQRGFKAMAPVQAATIPLLLQHQDVVVEAVTGSGKTLAYLIPAFELCQRASIASVIKANPKAVIAVFLFPTRELVFQVYPQARAYSAAVRTATQLDILCQAFVGGRDLEDDVERYSTSGGNLLLCTPGRLVDILLKSTVALHLKTVELLVLDEADRLLSMGFREQLDTILHALPRQRRTGLFSATQPREVRELARAGLRNAQLIRVKVQARAEEHQPDPQDLSADAEDKPAVPSALKNFYTILPNSYKLDELLVLLRTLENSSDKCIVFFLTCASVDFYKTVLPHLLQDHQMTFFALHGRRFANQRSGILKRFQVTPGPSVLLTTDLASRGIDFRNVPYIVQFDAPQDPDTFIHRAGRTARMGHAGTSILYLTPQEEEYVAYMGLQKVTLTLRPSMVYTPKEDESDASVRLEICPCPAIYAIRSVAKEDREWIDMGMKACVSYFRAYMEHVCQVIFKFSALNLVDVFHTFGLFQIPKMPELRGRRLRIPVQPEFAFVVPIAVPYKRKEVEEARVRSRQIKWERRQEKEREEEGRDTVRKQEAAEMEELGVRGRTEARLWKAFEIKEIMAEERLYKKLKKKKISKEYFYQLVNDPVLDRSDRKKEEKALQNGERPSKRRTAEKKSERRMSIAEMQKFVRDPCSRPKKKKKKKGSKRGKGGGKRGHH